MEARFASHMPSDRQRTGVGSQSSMEEGETTAEEISEEVIVEPVKPVIAPNSPVAKAAESVSAPGTSEKDDGFTLVGCNGICIAPIVIDAQSNATELLNQLGKLCETPLEGRFENGKLRVFPTSAEEHRVAVEPLNKSTMPPQCYRCQEFFHHSRFCDRAPKCLKCSGGHLTSECTKSAKAPAKCANCSGPHPANFSGCPKNPVNTKPTKNVWQEQAAARKQNKNQSKPSFAEIVKGTNNNSLDAKEVMTQMAQMMSQWGQMLSLLQTKL
ncbi:nucleic-acid-binding protein from transposon X-element [Trichonephila clavipes]|nr:nucleic-acid-binding protein from transposon X-element [Trichonephila clavipes]